MLTALTALKDLSPLFPVLCLSAGVLCLLVFFLISGTGKRERHLRFMALLNALEASRRENEKWRRTAVRSHHSRTGTMKPHPEHGEHTEPRHRRAFSLLPALPPAHEFQKGNQPDTHPVIVLPPEINPVVVEKNQPSKQVLAAPIDMMISSFPEHTLRQETSLLHLEENLRGLSCALEKVQTSLHAHIEHVRTRKTPSLERENQFFPGSNKNVQLKDSTYPNRLAS